MLKSVEVDPTNPNSPLSEVFFQATFVADPGPGRVPGQGTLSIQDGTSNTIFAQEGSQGIIAILIGLRSNRGMGMGTLQVVDAAGKPVLLLPYIEQDNLFRR